MPRSALFTVALLLAPATCAQIAIYGMPTPAGFTGTFDSAGQIPYAGNSHFKLMMHGHTNPLGGAVGLGFGPGISPFGPATIYVSLSGLAIVDMPPGVTQLFIPIPNVPSIV